MTVSIHGLTCAFAEGTLQDLISILNMNLFALVIPFVVFILLSHSLTYKQKTHYHRLGWPQIHGGPLSVSPMLGLQV